MNLFLRAIPVGRLVAAASRQTTKSPRQSLPSSFGFPLLSSAPTFFCRSILQTIPILLIPHSLQASQLSRNAHPPLASTLSAPHPRVRMAPKKSAGFQEGEPPKNQSHPIFTALPTIACWTKQQDSTIVLRAFQLHLLVPGADTHRLAILEMSRDGSKQSSRGIFCEAL